MRSWVFRNRLRLERIYGRRLAGSGLSAGREPDLAHPPGEEDAVAGMLVVYVLFPLRSPVLPAAG